MKLMVLWLETNQNNIFAHLLIDNCVKYVDDCQWWTISLEDDDELIGIDAKKVIGVDEDFLAEYLGADGCQRLGMPADDVVGNKWTLVAFWIGNWLG